MSISKPVRTNGPSPWAARVFGIRFFGDGGERLLLAAVAVYVLLFCLLPLVRLFAEAVVPTGDSGLHLIGQVLDSRSAQRALWHTIDAGLSATLVSVVLGTALALLVGLTNVRWPALIVFLLLLPTLVPAQITAVSWLELLSPHSLLLGPLGYSLPPGSGNPLHSKGGIVALLGIEHATMVFLSVRAGLRGIPRDLIEAARAAGAGPLRIIWTVILPLARPSIIAGAALAFVAAIGNFGIPALLGIPGRYLMLTTLIFQRLNAFGPTILGEVATLSMLLALLAGAGLILQGLMTRGLSAKTRRVEIEGTGAEGPVFSLGRARWWVEGTTWLVLLVMGVLPLLALVSSSLVAAIGVPLSWDTVTLENYQFALGHGATRRAFVNSTGLALAAAVGTVAISVPFAYLVLNRRNGAARILNVVADAPFALPGIVLSIAAILTFLPPLPVLGISLYNTLWIILIAYLGRFLAFGLRPTLAGLAQMDRTLEDAARVAGAGTLRRLWTIVLPHAAPAAMAGGILVFMGAFNELTVSALLWSAGNETLGVVVFNLYDEGNANGAAAVAVLTVVATLAVALLTTLAARRLPRGVLPWQA